MGTSGLSKRKKEGAAITIGADISADELKVFIEEANEQIALLDSDLVRLETEGKDPDLIQEIFRATHTLKGSSAMLGYQPMSELAHAMESLLANLRSGDLPVNAEIVDSLLYGLDLLKVLRDNLVCQKDDLPDIDSAIARLESVAGLARTPPHYGTDTTGNTTNASQLNDGNQSVICYGSAEIAQGGQKDSLPNRLTNQFSTQTVRVDVKTLDNLMNMVEELVIDRSRISQINRTLESKYAGDELIRELSQTSNHIIRVINELQQDIMQVRMVPIGTLFNSFPRMVRDLAQKQGKRIEFIMEGLETELDRSIIEQIRDPLIHLLRNAIDHGVEAPEKRMATGKPPVGLVKLSAFQEGGHIVIMLEDDGKGIDINAVKQTAVKKSLISAEEASRLSPADAVNLIFLPGFSTLDKPTDLSGRGVGLDVVKTNIERLSGSIMTESEAGKGTKFMIVLPLTLAVIQGLLVAVHGTVYVIPLASVTEALLIEPQEIQTIRGRDVVRVRNKIIPLVALNAAPGVVRQQARRNNRFFIVVAKDGDKSIGIVVDELLEQQEFVIKPLGKFLCDINGIAGATILGDGQVALILDIPALIRITSRTGSG